MSMNFEKPIGIKDVLPDRLKLQKAVSHNIKEILNQWGYERSIHH